MKEEIIIKRVQTKLEELKEYCEKYQSWPKCKAEKYREDKNDKTGNKLASWLKAINYDSNEGEFLYPNILDKNGKKAIDVIDELYEKYGKTPKKTIDMIYRIKAYYEKYNELPKKINNPQTKKEEESTYLYTWLKHQKYKMAGETCKFQEAKDSNGNKLIDIIDEIFIKGKENKIREQAIKKVMEIQELCEKDGFWPIYKHYDKTDEFDVKLRNLYIWLYEHNYFKDFDYKNIYISENETLKDRLDLLRMVYGIKIEEDTYFTKEAVLGFVKLLKNYCEKYKEWPKKYQYVKTKRENISTRLFNWIKASNFYKGKEEFKYNELVDENGNNIYEVLKELYIKYGYQVQNYNPHAIYMARQLEDYCRTFEEWPSQLGDPNTIKGQLSKQLYIYVLRNGCIKEESEYSHYDIENEEGIKIGSIVDNCYHEYATKKHTASNYTIPKEIWEQRSIKDIGMSLFHDLMKLITYRKSNDYSKYYKTLETMNQNIENNNINIDLVELSKVIGLDLQKKKAYFYKKYTLCSIMNMNIEATFYHLGLDYIETEIKKECKNDVKTHKLV